MMNKSPFLIRRAFTLVELLVVIGIIALLSAILFPVFAHVREAARQTVAISNIRQCGIALKMYMEDNNPDLLPTTEAARVILKNAPTCDPGDYWRASCDAPAISPMIGSFAYAGDISPYNKPGVWEWYRKLGNQSPTLLMSIFHTGQHIPKFTGTFENFKDCINNEAGCRMPTTVIRMRLDGSAAVVPVKGFKGSEKYSISWANLFLLDPGNRTGGK